MATIGKKHGHSRAGGNLSSHKSTLPLGQLFVFGFDGLKPCPTTIRLLSEMEACGVTLFKRNIESLEQVVALNGELTQLGSGHPTLITVDQEGGRVARLRGILTDVPPMRTIGNLSVDSSDVPYRIGAMMGRELGALGFHLDFAPDLDVDHCKADAIIGDRSFSQYPEHVGSCGSQFIKGLQGAGVAACGKHFPGHGGTEVDSHHCLPVLDADKKALMHRAILPFKEAIAANVASIMTGHIMLPNLDPDYPATVSPTILTQILRNKLGFEGVIFSDDCNMRALTDKYELKELIELGIHAGIDIFLICEYPERTIQAIEIVQELLAAGKIKEKQVTDALNRIHGLKKRYIGEAQPPELDFARMVVKSKPHQKLMQELGFPVIPA